MATYYIGGSNSELFAQSFFEFFLPVAQRNGCELVQVLNAGRENKFGVELRGDGRGILSFRNPSRPRVAKIADDAFNAFRAGWTIPADQLKTQDEIALGGAVCQEYYNI